MPHTQTALVVAGITAAAALLVAILGALAAYWATKRDRRRTIYGEAVRAVLAWKEMLYRVRRRQVGQEGELIALFHDRQDDLSYYRAWIGSESPSMQRSYDKFVGATKAATEALLREAWAAPTRATVEPTDGNQHPDISTHTASFLKDVRSHLSPWPWRKIAVWCRYRSGGS